MPSTFTLSSTAAAYAWGRMDAGDPPIVDLDPNPLHATRPNTTDTVRRFTELWTSVPQGDERPSVQDAWTNFVISDGTSVLPPRIPTQQDGA